MFFYPFNYLQRNTQAVTIAAEKLKNRNLPIEQILDEDELMNDLKFSTNSQLVNHLTKEDLFGLINYVIRDPEVDEHKPAYKYPFNAADILSGENTYLLDKFFEDSNVFEEDRYEELDEEVEKLPHQVNEESNQNSKSNEIEKNIETANETKEIMDEINEVVQKIQNIELQANNEETKLEEKEILEETKKENIDGMVENSSCVDQAPRDETDKEDLEQEIVKKIENSDNKCENSNEIQNDNVCIPVIEEANIQGENSKVDINEVLNENNQNKIEKVIAPKFEIFDHFLSFLDSDKDLNYVLCGYFSKIFNSLKYNRPGAVTRYLYVQKNEYLFKMVNHINRKAIADTLLKVLLIDACEIVSDINVESEIQLKYDIVEKIIDSFNGEDEERCQNICDLLSEAFNNRKFSIIIMKSPNLLKKIQTAAINNINSEYFKDIMKITSKLSDTVLKEIKIKLNKDSGIVEDNFDKGYNPNDFDDMVPNKQVESLDFKDNLYILETLALNLEPMIKDYIDDESSQKILSTFDRTVKILGSKRLLEFEYIKNIFEILLLSLNNKIFEFSANNTTLSQQSTTANNDVDTQSLSEYETDLVNKNSEIYKIFHMFSEKLIEFNFFGKSIENFFYFEWNNSYQRHFEDFMVVVINSNADYIVEHIFSTLNFLENILEHSLSIKFVFNSGKFINSGYLPFLMEISYNIMMSKNEVLINMVAMNERWERFYTYFVDPIRKRFASGLRYDPQHESNLFKEEFSQETSSPKKSEVQEFEERNYIQNIRKQAKSSFSGSTTMSVNEEEESKGIEVNQEFYDNMFWKADFSGMSTDDLLADLD